MKRKRSLVHVTYRKKLAEGDWNAPWVVILVKAYDIEGDEIGAEQPCIIVGGVRQERVVGRYRIKRDAVWAGRQEAKELEPSTLRIHGKDGKIQEERTYPRSSDPKKTKG